MAHLRIIGYPSYWMSEVLFNILENKVHTTARPPRQSPNTLSEVTRDHPEKYLGTSPFTQEMGTLTKIFEPLLPFPLLSLLVIPNENDIFKYKFNLSNVHLAQKFSINVGHAALVFCDDRILKACADGEGLAALGDMRSVLDSCWGDEKDGTYRIPSVVDLRENGLIVWSTIEYDVVNSIASAWMPKEFVEKLKNDSWMCGLWRVDIWEGVSSELWPVRGAVVEGERWGDNV